MSVLIDILQGAGLAGAVGVRPLLPALVAGALARADLGVDYEHTPFAFLEQSGWLLAVVLALVALVALQRAGRAGGPVESALQGIGIGLGAVLFAGTLAGDTDTWWPGLLAGGLCAALATAATRSLLVRVRARLDAEARGALPVYLEGAAVVLAGLSVAVVGVLSLPFFAFLLRGGRRREGEKYAGLRILR